MIKFPPRDQYTGRPRDYSKDLHELSADASGHKFCPRFSNVLAIGLDSVSADFTGWTGRTYSSVDAVKDVRNDPDVDEAERRIYFIEFKNRTFKDLNTQGTACAISSALKKEEPIAQELRKKAFDSLMLSGATIFMTEAIDNIAWKAEFIVVYNDRKFKPSESRAVEKFDTDIGALGMAGKDSYGVEVRWGLNELKRRRVFRSVHTWSIEEFNYYAPSFLR